ncbi:MAG: hypothetical protein J6N52_09910 [Clostridia bacterium]|nr:hypothetical protein [Clostridia bacterium]
MKFKLHKYIIPSVISMVIVGTNANIDGIFIGRLLGDDGLAAINIVWPILAFIAAVGTGTGVGGAVILNELRGKGKAVQAEKIKNTTMCLMIIISAFITALFLLSYSGMLRLMGASGNVLVLSEEYAFVIICGAVSQIIGAGILVLLRNDGKSYNGMFFSVIGVVLHVGLDFTLAKRFGMRGVAMATLISQSVIAVLGLLTIKTDKAAGVDFSGIPDIIRGSIAPFGINFVPSLVLMFTNCFALKCGGVSAVSAYALMCYVIYTFDYIFQGVCDGVQPVISYCRGSRDIKQERRALKCSGIILLVMSVIFALITPIIIKVITGFFDISDEAEKMFRTGLVIFMLSYPFKAAVKYVCSYYYAVKNTVISNILVFIDPLLITPLLLAVLSELMGINGVWLAMPVSQFVMTGISMVIFLRNVLIK